MEETNIEITKENKKELEELYGQIPDELEDIIYEISS